MKRQAKTFLFLMSFLCLVGLSMVLCWTQRNAGQSFPGAVVVLDDMSWRSRYLETEDDSGYLWTTSDTVLYKQKTLNGYRIIRRKITLDGNPVPPEVLPITVTSSQRFDSLSPNGEILCLYEEMRRDEYQYTLVRPDGKGKPILFTSEANGKYWSPDSKYLYGLPSFTEDQIIERRNALTGAVSRITLDTKQYIYLQSITPEGRILGFNCWGSMVSTDMAWQVTELRDKKIISTVYRNPAAPPASQPTSSLDCKRLLWSGSAEQITWMQKLEQKVFGKAIKPQDVLCWHITDIDGKNKYEIGSIPDEGGKGNEPEPAWTPNGKGVHFIQDGKLMYLAVR